MIPLRVAAAIVVLAMFPAAGRALLPPEADADPPGGFAYVGTLNPSGKTLGELPAIDLAPIATSTVVAMDHSSTHEEVHGGTVQVEHFGIGLAQTFAAIAQIDGTFDVTIGEIHYFTATTGTVAPLQYDFFPGVSGLNPFYTESSVGFSGSFIDTITIPATTLAPNMGDLDTVSLGILVDCSVQNTTGSVAARSHGSADLLNDSGGSIGSVMIDNPPQFSPGSYDCPWGGTNSAIQAPVLTPLNVRLLITTGVGIVAGNGLPGGDLAGGTASVDAMQTAVVTVTNSDGLGAIGSLGRDYSYGAYQAMHSSSTTTTTSTTTTSSYMPPTTLPGCTGYCGDGTVQTDCAEACECPMGPGMQVNTLCDAATSTPTLQPACARCAGCQRDLSQCAASSTTTSTTPGSATTTTSSLPGSAEICDNCIDDNGNGQIDLEDAACCIGMPPGTTVTKLDLKSSKGATTFVLDAVLAAAGAPLDLTTTELELQIAEVAGHRLLCAHVSGEQFLRKKKGVVAFHATPGADIDTIVARPAHDGLHVLIRGRVVTPSGGATDAVHVAVGLVSETGRCGAATPTLHRSRKGKGKTLHFP